MGQTEMTPLSTMAIKDFILSLHEECLLVSVNYSGRKLNMLIIRLSHLSNMCLVPKELPNPKLNYDHNLSHSVMAEFLDANAKCAIMLVNGKINFLALTNHDIIGNSGTSAKTIQDIQSNVKLVHGVATNMAIQIDGKAPFKLGRYDSVRPFIYLKSIDDHVR